MYGVARLGLYILCQPTKTPRLLLDDIDVISLDNRLVVSFVDKLCTDSRLVHLLSNHKTTWLLLGHIDVISPENILVVSVVDRMCTDVHVSARTSLVNQQNNSVIT